MTVNPSPTSPREENRVSWIGGLAKKRDGDTTYISVAFTWKLPEARHHAIYEKACGRRVVVGGPGVFRPNMKAYMADVAEIGAVPLTEAVTLHNPDATVASRGCPVGCKFCIVPQMEGLKFTLIDDFVPRPILCDNNLSALPFDFQKHIISRYAATGVPLMDANSGFEPKTFSEDVFNLWKPINRGPWRFASDEARDRPHVRRVMKMLKGENQKRKRVYVLIGNEPFDACMDRIREVIDGGCEPHVQPEMALDTLTRVPLVKHDWTMQQLKDVARWANGFVWKKVPFNEYDRSRRNSPNA